jgi:antitoxin VapB
MPTAKLFTLGGSQALRIPKSMRLPGERVSIRKVGHALVIEPQTTADWSWLDSIEPVDDSFMADGRNQKAQKRPALDKLFG